MQVLLPPARIATNPLIKNEMPAMAFVAVPEFQRRAAGRSPIRVMVPAALSSHRIFLAAGDVAR
jgi:hypothetical protein